MVDERPPAEVRIAHLSDLHFGGHADVPQMEVLERFLLTLPLDAVAVSGDVSQRGRHGEFQRARAFLRHVEQHAPTLVVPGNHDVQWWRSPFGIRGEGPKYANYRQYINQELTPVLRIPGAVIAGALSAHGLSWGSLTWNPRDVTVKGHLPASEIERVRNIFAGAPAGAARILVLHHNVLPGELSGRMGLANWKRAHQLLVSIGADVVLCGHDHQEMAEELREAVPVSAAGTLSLRMRGGRPSVFNLVRIDARSVHIQHFRWDAPARLFRPSDTFTFARRGSQHAVVSVAGGGEEL